MARLAMPEANLSAVAGLASRSQPSVCVCVMQRAGVEALVGLHVAGVDVVQPVAFDGPLKMANYLTLDRIATAVVAQGLATEVEVQAPVTPFKLREGDGRLVAESGAPPEAEELLAGLAPAPEVWRDVEVEGGPDGILARRPIKMKGNPQGYVYDLWLVERLADRLAG